MNTYAPTADPTAVSGRRVVAAIIDVLIGAAVGLILFFTLAESGEVGPFVDCADLDSSFNQCIKLGDTMYVLEGSEATTNNLISTAYAIGVYVLLRGFTGATPGTWLLGLRVVNAEGRPIGPIMALVRSVAGVVDYLPCCFPLVGTIMIFANKSHQRVGDLAAKSYMVGKEHVGRPLVIPGVTPPGLAGGGYGSPGYGAPGYGAPPPGGYAAPPPGGYAPPAGGYGAPAPGAPAPGTTPPPPGGSDPAGATVDPDIGWGAPGGPTPSPEAGASAASEPQWDAARNAYIQWDPNQQVWLQYDDATQQWRPIQ